MSSIKPITMPKWGLSMDEGILARWNVDDGSPVVAGDEIMDIETDKIANGFESPAAGTLRHVASEGDTLPVGALLAVVSGPGIDQAEIDRFVSAFLADFKPPESTDDSGPSPEAVQAGAHRIQRLKAGPDDAPSILLVHGFGADISTWMFNQADLAKDHRVDAIDLPGHGGSAKEVADGSVDGLATAVLDYMDAAELSKSHIVGHSLGGAIAVRVATVAPDRVSGLTLLAPAGMGAEISETFIRDFVEQTRARKLRQTLGMLVADPAMVTAEMVEAVLRFKRLDGAQSALRSIAAACFDGGTQRLILRDEIARLTMPIQVIWGEVDQILPASQAGDLPTQIKTTIIPGAGHIVHMERAGDINKAIAEIAG